MISIKNAGAPTIVEGWQLAVGVPTGHEFQARRILLNFPKLEFPSRSGKATVTLFAEDNLYRKDVDKPIERGGKHPSYMSFEVERPESELFVKGTKIKLSLDDVNGTTNAFVQEVSGINEDPLAYPGFKVPESAAPKQ